MLPFDMVCIFCSTTFSRLDQHGEVPSLPRSLLDRVKFLEDHLVRLEKDYPPWAALHFNQPHRGVRDTHQFPHPSMLILTTVASSTPSYAHHRPFPSDGNERTTERSVGPAAYAYP